MTVSLISAPIPSIVADLIAPEVYAQMMEEIDQNSAVLRASEVKPNWKATENQMLSLIEKNVNGCTMATVHAATCYDAKKCVKKHRTSGKPTSEIVALPITKTYGINFPLGAIYENVVNRQRVREGKADDFKAQGYVNGAEHISKYAVRQQNGNVCLCCTSLEIFQYAGETRYFDANGVELTGETLEDIKANIMPAESKQPKTQGTEVKIVHITPSMSNVRYLIMKGVVWEILHN